MTDSDKARLEWVHFTIHHFKAHITDVPKPRLFLALNSNWRKTTGFKGSYSRPEQQVTKAYGREFFPRRCNSFHRLYRRQYLLLWLQPKASRYCPSPQKPILHSHILYQQGAFKYYRSTYTCVSQVVFSTDSSTTLSNNFRDIHLYFTLLPK